MNDSYMNFEKSSPKFRSTRPSYRSASDGSFVSKSARVTESTQPSSGKGTVYVTHKTTITQTRYVQKPNQKSV